MEPNQTKSKLQLKKQAVSNLSNADLNTIKGGAQEAWTTSIGNCTGFACCGETQTCTTALCTVSLCTIIITIIL
ncbi:class I lanthipeptide [Ferruginibacter sp. SUN106]|uniref:class I lanthipeptide n=1 Tax=Ferruginibacter sp. SUN106 TaxID=2978348 RepID=UPI003D36A512